MGELVAWIIGWDLILEYGVSVAAVAVGWGQYFNELLDSLFGLSLPDSLANPPGEDGGAFNLPAVFLVLAVTALLIFGVRESARANAVMVIIKLAIVVLFIVLAFTGFDCGQPDAVQPRRASTAWSTAASVIFFAYIGFDAISTSGEEVKNPGRDLPIAIIGSLAICTLLYILVSHRRDRRDAVQGARRPGGAARRRAQDARLRLGRDRDLVRRADRDHQRRADVLYGQTRIMFAMCRDGLLPRGVREVSETRRTPVRITADFGILIAVARRVRAARGDREAGQHRHAVRVRDHQHRRDRAAPHAARPRARLPRPVRAAVPDHRRRLRIYLMTVPRAATRGSGSALWLLLGLVIYFAYGRRHSRLRRGGVVNPEADLPAG